MQKWKRSRRWPNHNLKKFDITESNVLFLSEEADEETSLSPTTTTTSPTATTLPAPTLQLQRRLSPRIVPRRKMSFPAVSINTPQLKQQVGINPIELFSFHLFNEVSMQLIVNKFVEDWFRTVDLWCQNWPLYQLTNKHCPTVLNLTLSST